MQVVTTHEPLFRALHGRTCKKNHDHQHLEGSTQIHGHSILRTKFSEIYPRKFVRLVAKVLCQRGHHWPFQWKTGLALCQCNSGDPTPGLAASQKRRDSFARSQLSTPEESDEAGVKRRRLEGKQGQSSTHPTPTVNRETGALDDPMPANPEIVSLQPMHPSPQNGEVHSPRALQSNGQRPEMVKAALELKCGICAASSAPKHQRPGSVLSDESLPAHTAAIQENSEFTAEQFRDQLRLREVARRAFHTADNSDALRSRLYRSAPENVRLSLPEEGEPGGPDLPEDLTQIQQQINRISQHPEAMQSIPENEPLEPDIDATLQIPEKTTL
ncbi:unnamed protein product [Cladocopium goreaui]|uniref:Uncharacterized protein n=1 Tax=Cladocopium goreaui TaxID=2562237 RepID=A0A9P1CW26_9DINO|nr:unnamed protein product [Cladocopium goreaui]